MTPAVEVRGLCFAYPGGAELLRNVSFTVERGAFFVLAGLSGCGKTTLCRILSGMIPNAVPGTLTGEVRLFGQSIAGRPLRELSAQVGLVFQDADSQMVCTTVEDEVAFGLENLCVPPEELRRRVDGMLERWGLSGLREMDPARLSGGQRRLTALASVLVLEPELVILDEPMSSLDEEGRALVKEAVDRLRKEGRTVIMVEHDLSLAEGADWWLILREGRVAALDRPAAFRAAPDRLRELEMAL